MAEYTFEQYREAARKAAEAGDVATARKLIARAKAVPLSKGERFAAGVNNFAESLSLGIIGDEANAGFDALVGRGSEAETFKERYAERLDDYRTQEERFKELNSGAALTTELAPALIPMSASLQNIRNMKAATQGLVLGGVGGATYGFAEGEGGATDRLQGAAGGGILGSVLGGVGSMLGGRIAKALEGRRARRAATRAIQDALPPEVLEANARQIFEQADTVPLDRGILAQAVDEASTRINPRRGADQVLMPKTARVLDNFAEVATDPNPQMQLGELLDVRKQTAAPLGMVGDKVEQRGGAIIKDVIDETVAELSQEQAGLLKEANRTWTMLRKNEVIEEAINRAQYAASGFENGLRTEFRKFAKNPKKFGFTQAEVSAIEEVVKGSGVGNLMKRLGRLSFGRGQQTNVLSGTAGAAVFGPGSLVLGEGASMLSEGATQRAAQRVSDLVRAGGAPQYTPGAPSMLPGIFGQQGARMGGENAGLLEYYGLIPSIATR